MMGSIAPHLGGPDELAGRVPMFGIEAPAFQMRDEEGNYVTLRRLLRQRPLLLHLYRGAW
jgi:peroxiredoxin